MNNGMRKENFKPLNDLYPCTYCSGRVLNPKWVGLANVFITKVKALHQIRTDTQICGKERSPE